MKYTTALVWILVLCVSCDEQNETRRRKDGTKTENNFSGEWRSKESISMGGNIVCLYADGDRMRSKTIKIAEQQDFLTIEVPSQSPDTALGRSREKLALDGKEIEISYGREKGKKSTVKLSDDGQTMTVNSIVYLKSAVPFTIDTYKQQIVYVTEVWKLSNDGKTISIQANAKANLIGDERSWETVFEKVR